MRFDALFTSQGCCNKLTPSGLDVRHSCTKATVSAKVFILETLGKKKSISLSLPCWLPTFFACVPFQSLKPKPANGWLSLSHVVSILPQAHLIPLSLCPPQQCWATSLGQSDVLQPLYFLPFSMLSSPL